MRFDLSYLLLLAAFAMATAFADDTPSQTRRIPAHNPEWTSPGTSDPGQSNHLEAVPAGLNSSAAEDLQKIVVLCATEPRSSAFRAEWQAYLRRHYVPQTDIDTLIDTVMTRAEVHRQEFGQTQGKRREKSAMSPVATRKAMHDTAMSTIRNMK